MPVVKTAGASISYAKTGTGPAVLMIQGAGVVGEGWRPQVEALSAGYTTYVFDNRGMGASPLDAGGTVTIADMAGDALAVVDAEGVSDFHVVGHSMGGLIAQALTLAVPHRVKSLSLLCTFVKGAQGAKMSLPMLATAMRMRIGSKPMRRNAFLELIMPVEYLRGRDRSQLARELAPLFGYDLASQPYFVMRQVQAMAAYDERRRWAELGVPALVVSAKHDRIALPEYGRALARELPDARYVEIIDAGHGVTIQDARQINSLLREHLASIQAPLGSR